LRRYGGCTPSLDADREIRINYGFFLFLLLSDKEGWSLNKPTPLPFVTLLKSHIPTVLVFLLVEGHSIYMLKIPQHTLFLWGMIGSMILQSVLIGVLRFQEEFVPGLIVE